ncbi:MAG: MarR family transcriptional regulator [Sphingobium sp.]
MQREIAQILPNVSRSWRQLADTVLAEFGVSNSMAWCLIYLERLGPEARQTDLAQAIGITQPSTVRVLDQLEAAGLVARAQDPDDRRSNRLTLTDEGKAQHGRIEASLAALRNTLFDGVAEGDIAATLRVLDALSGHIAERRG